MKTQHPPQNLFSQNPEINVSKVPTTLSTNELGYVILHGEFTLFSSVTQSCPTLCEPMDCSTPGFPVHHQLRELAQTHVPQIGDAIQPSHPLSSSSPPALNLSQHQGLFPVSQFFASGGQTIGASASASVLPINTQVNKITLIG